MDGKEKGGNKTEMQTVSSRDFSHKDDRQETFVVKEAILSNGCKEMSRGVVCFPGGGRRR